MRSRQFDRSINHKQGIARSFNRAANNYDRYAAFQRACGYRLCTLLGRIKEQQLLDAGCGTGWFSRYWKAQGNTVIALDLSIAMLIRARQQHSASIYLTGDIEKLPLATGSVDSVFSNLALQWCSSMPKALAELYRVLKPGGVLAISTLASGSLTELEQAWSQIDDRIHINKFLSEAAISEAFAIYKHRLLVELYHLYYPNLTELLKEIKGVGAGYLYSRRAAGLNSRNRLKELEACWKKQSSSLLLSYRVAYGVLYHD